MINFAATARAYQMWNDVPNDIPNHVIRDFNSSLYPVITEDQFQAYSKKKSKGH